MADEMTDEVKMALDNDHREFEEVRRGEEEDLLVEAAALESEAFELDQKRSRNWELRGELADLGVDFSKAASCFARAALLQHDQHKAGLLRQKAAQMTLALNS